MLFIARGANVVAHVLQNAQNRDVDGLEHFILENGPDVLSKTQGILVEINDDFTEQAEKSKEALEGAGLTFVEKRHSIMIENSTSGFKRTFNQIWVRK